MSIAQTLGIKSDEGKDIAISKDEKKDELTLGQKVKRFTLIGGGVLLVGGAVYLGVSSIRYQTMRRKVENDAKTFASAEYAVAMAAAFKQFGGFTEKLYDTVSEYLPSFFVPADSDFEAVKKIANALNHSAITNANGFDAVMDNFASYFKDYTRKDFDEVARRVLDDGQYQELIGILENKDKGAIAENTFADVQDDSLIWNEQNVVKYALSVGTMMVQADLKNRIVMCKEDIDYAWWQRDAVIYQFDGKSISLSDDKRVVYSNYLINKQEDSCAAGAVLGVLTGRVSRPDIGYNVDDYFRDIYFVEFVSCWDKKLYWARVTNLAFAKGKENAKKNIDVTAKNSFINAMSKYMLEKCTMIDGSPLKGIDAQATDSAAIATRTRAQITGINGAFPVFIGGYIAHYHTFIEGEIVGEMGDDILFGYEKGNVNIPKKLISIKVLS